MQIVYPTYQMSMVSVQSFNFGAFLVQSFCTTSGNMADPCDVRIQQLLQELDDTGKETLDKQNSLATATGKTPASEENWMDKMRTAQERIDYLERLQIKSEETIQALRSDVEKVKQEKLDLIDFMNHRAHRLSQSESTIQKLQSELQLLLDQLKLQTVEQEEQSRSHIIEREMAFRQELNVQMGQQQRIEPPRRTHKPDMDPCVIDQDSVPMIVCSIGLGMIVSALVLLIMWYFCRRNKIGSKDVTLKSDQFKCRKLEEMSAESAIDSDVEVIRHHIKVLEDGQHVTSAGSESMRHTSVMDWSEELHEDKEMESAQTPQLVDGMRANESVEKAQNTKEFMNRLISL